jgi:uncharacterized protein RhaS with RHS repeats
MNGRFISPDPIGVKGGLNLYQYCENPVIWIDPLGLAKKCKDKKKEEPSGPGKMQKEVERGQAPRSVEAVHPGHVPGQEPHVHYADGTSSTQTGRTHDAHGGTPNPNKDTRQWLEQHGWTPPPK